jgi:hypothetical protein
VLGISRGDYTQWQWHDLGPEFNGFGGPNLIQLPTGPWLAAGRMHQDGPHTALCYLDMKEHKMTKLLKLPSGGDTSYPGLVWHNDLLYLSYYSSHEGKASIYSKIKIMWVCLPPPAQRLLLPSIMVYRTLFCQTNLFSLR